MDDHTGIHFLSVFQNLSNQCSSHLLRYDDVPSDPIHVFESLAATRLDSGLVSYGGVVYGELCAGTTTNRFPVECTVSVSKHGMTTDANGMVRVIPGFKIQIGFWIVWHLISLESHEKCYSYAS